MLRASGTLLCVVAAVVARLGVSVRKVDAENAANQKAASEEDIEIKFKQGQEGDTTVFRDLVSIEQQAVNPLFAVVGSGCVPSGDCVATRRARKNGKYGSNDYCEIQITGMVHFAVTKFVTERGHDKLTLNGEEYSGTDKLPEGRVTGSITWTSDDSVQKSGWDICFAAAPVFEVSGSGCVSSGDCVATRRANNVNDNYGSRDYCDIQIIGDRPVHFAVTRFVTEAGGDKLEINGVNYSGSPDKLPEGNTCSSITWRSNWFYQHSGWEICFGAAPRNTECPPLPW